MENVPDRCKFCFICAIRPVLAIGLFNTFSANFFCAHSNPPTHPHFEKSKFWRVFTFACCCVLLVSSALTVLSLSSQSLNELFLSIMMIESCAVVTIVILSLQKFMTLQIDHVHGILYIVENSRAFGVKSFFDKSFKNYILKLLAQLFLPYLLLAAVVLGASLYNYEKLNRELVRKLVTLLINIFSNLSNFIVCICFMDIYFVLFEKCHKQIQTELIQHKSVRTLEFSLKRKLRMLQILHMKIYANFQLVLKLFNVNLVLFWIVFVTILILNFFIIITRIWEKSPMTDEEVLSWVLYVTGFMGSNVFFQRLQRLQDESQETMSFLFQFPITKLKVMEAAQVEMLIVTLKTQRPILRAYDIFNVNKRLLAAVFGTVVTYLLAALQFFVLWSKKK